MWRACHRLNEVLAGRELTRSEFRVPSLATTDLTGVGVREVISRGKHQLFRLSNDFTLHTHFRMDGAWRIYPCGRRWSGGPVFEIRAVLATSDHDVVGYRLPVIELLPTEVEDTVVGHLGPDLLGPDWNLEEAVRRIAAQPDRTIGEALLDQRNLAGLGTFYRAELLFLHGVHPRTPVHQVRNLRRIVEGASGCFRQTAGVPSSQPPEICDQVGAATSTNGQGSPAAAAEHPSAPRSSGREARNGAATGVRIASRVHE